MDIMVSYLRILKNASIKNINMNPGEERSFTHRHNNGIFYITYFFTMEAK